MGNAASLHPGDEEDETFDRTGSGDSYRYQVKRLFEHERLDRAPARWPEVKTPWFSSDFLRTGRDPVPSCDITGKATTRVDEEQRMDRCGNCVWSSPWRLVVRVATTTQQHFDPGYTDDQGWQYAEGFDYTSWYPSQAPGHRVRRRVWEQLRQWDSSAPVVTCRNRREEFVAVRNRLGKLRRARQPIERDTVTASLVSVPLQQCLTHVEALFARLNLAGLALKDIDARLCNWEQQPEVWQSFAQDRHAMLAEHADALIDIGELMQSTLPMPPTNSLVTIVGDFRACCLTILQNALPQVARLPQDLLDQQLILFSLMGETSLELAFHRRKIVASTVKSNSLPVLHSVLGDLQRDAGFREQFPAEFLTNTEALKSAMQTIWANRFQNAGFDSRKLRKLIHQAAADPVMGEWDELQALVAPFPHAAEMLSEMGQLFYADDIFTEPTMDMSEVAKVQGIQSLEGRLDAIHDLVNDPVLQREAPFLFRSLLEWIKVCNVKKTIVDSKLALGAADLLPLSALDAAEACLVMAASLEAEQKEFAEYCATQMIRALHMSPKPLLWMYARVAARTGNFDELRRLAAGQNATTSSAVLPGCGISCPFVEALLQYQIGESKLIVEFCLRLPPRSAVTYLTQAKLVNLAAQIAEAVFIVYNDFKLFGLVLALSPSMASRELVNRHLARFLEDFKQFSWQRAAGRTEGGAEYHFGDASRMLLQKVMHAQQGFMRRSDLNAGEVLAQVPKGFKLPELTESSTVLPLQPVGDKEGLKNLPAMLQGLGSTTAQPGRVTSPTPTEQNDAGSAAPDAHQLGASAH
eukprot:m.193835 g.193835  ORF g.193835 m.193835 type:complete len:807 (-) comp18298_c0_seq11:55-2475(-)